MKKKWIAISIVLLLIVCAIGGVFVARNGSNNGQGEPTPTITIPSGNTLKVLFDGPPELKMTVNKVGFENFEPYLSATITNTSTSTVVIGPGGVGFLIDGQQQGVWSNLTKVTINPGASVSFKNGVNGWTTDSKVLTVKVTDYNVVGSGATQTVEPTQTQAVGATKTSEVYTFSLDDYPKNPKSPQEVVAAFYGLLFDGKYEEAAKLANPDLQKQFQEAGGLDKFVAAFHDQFGDKNPARMGFYLTHTAAT